ncbi:MAG: helix-turn-helix domain-containing protein [Parvularculaceae bacterium]
MLEYLDIYFRMAGVTLLLVQAVLIARDAWDVRPARFGFILAISLIDVVGSNNSPHIHLPLALQYAISLMSMNTAIFIWWFSLSLFEDDFRLGKTEWGVAALWFALGLFNYNDFVLREPLSHPWATYARSAMAVGIVAHIAYRALAGRGGDLIEQRRRIRILFAFAIAALFLADLGSEFAFGFFGEPLWFSVIEHGGFFAVIVWSVFWLSRFERSALTFERAPVLAAPAEPELTAKERALHARLVKAMEEEKAYLDPELSIGALAMRIGAPEHQLRALINAAMGHRNFRAFLNDYRLAAVRRDLGDPDKAALPILTIAMDAGFASLSSFNRAFKEQTGKTPSEWRDEKLTAQEPTKGSGAPNG